MSFLSGLLRPEVEGHLLTTESEFVVDQVEKHWITRVPGFLLVFLGIVAFAAMPLMRQAWLVLLVLGLVAGAVGFWRIHAENMDRFVVTNVRVFRVNGVLNQKMASVPLLRLLDITVDRPLLGQVFHYGHFVFETAAQDQGLKRVAFVPNITKRELILQTVIQRAGVRVSAGEAVDEFQEMFDTIAEGQAAKRPHLPVPRRFRRDAGAGAVDGNEQDGT